MLSVITTEELRRQLATGSFVKFDKRQSIRFIPQYQSRAPHIAANGVAVNYKIEEENSTIFIVIAGERYRLVEVDLDPEGRIQLFVYEGKGECSLFQRVYRRFT